MLREKINIMYKCRLFLTPLLNAVDVYTDIDLPIVPRKSDSIRLKEHEIDELEVKFKRDAESYGRYMDMVRKKLTNEQITFKQIMEDCSLKITAIVLYSNEEKIRVIVCLPYMPILNNKTVIDNSKYELLFARETLFAKKTIEEVDSVIEKLIRKFNEITFNR